MGNFRNFSIRAINDNSCAFKKYSLYQEDQIVNENWPTSEFEKKKKMEIRDHAHANVR